VASDVELVIVNKFGKTEAEGRGLRSEIAEAILASKPVLTAVSTRIYPAWQSFTGSFGTMLICDESIVRGWWQDIAQKIDRRRLGLPAAVRSMTCLLYTSIDRCARLNMSSHLHDIAGIAGADQQRLGRYFGKCAIVM